MAQKSKNPAGFSLIEVLFAMLFLSIIVFGVIRLQTSNLTLSNTSKQELKAHFYAAQALEIVEALGYGGIPDCPSGCYLTGAGTYSLNPGDPEELEDGLFERSVWHDDATLANASVVTARVEWTDSAGDHFVEAKRVLAN
jgi:Tfp pilus assembly protein PilW